MKNLKINLGILAVLGLLVPIAPASPVVDWAGTWIGSIDTQGMGVDTITLVLKKADTTYTGIINDSLGLIEKDTVITEVKLDGEAISLSFKAVGGSMDFVMKMTAGGETITAQMMNKAIGEWGSFESLIKK
jgi:hypothetical protein